MRNPLDIEQRYQDFVHSLAYPGAGLHRLINLNHFLSHLGDEAAQYESYVLDGFGRLPPIVQALHPGDFPPEDLYRIYEFLLKLYTSIPSLQEVEGIGDAISGLEMAIGAQYVFAGEMEAALRVLKREAGPPSWFPIIPRDKPVNRWDLLSWTIEQARSRVDPIADRLEQLMGLWSASSTSRHNEVQVPVIERPVSSALSEQVTGMIRALSVTITGEKKIPPDELHSTVAVFGVSAASTALTGISVSAARMLIEETYSALSHRYFTGHLSFDSTEAFHEGSSANLAIAALFYAAILHSSGQRVQFGFRPGVAISGNLNEEGVVLSVDPGTLNMKVQAVFFSPAESLVLPRPQMEKAEQHLRRLNQTYPRRKLDLIPVGHLRDVFYDLRVIEQTKAPVAIHIARKIWQRRFRAVALALIAVLALLVAFLSYGPIDKNPVGAVFEGEEMIMKNMRGETVERIRVGANTVSNAQLGRKQMGPLKQRVVCVDVNKDGMNEFIYIQCETQELKGGDYAVCRSIGVALPLWSKPLRLELHFPRKPEVLSDRFNAIDLEAGDFDMDGTPELILIGTHNFFPSVLWKFNARNGNELSHYLHIGHLTDISTVDLNGDGAKEILACGMNQAYHCASLMVLDSRQVSGRSPTDRDYLPDGYAPGAELVYVLIPRTAVGNVFRFSVRENFAYMIQLHESSRQFDVNVEDCGGLDSMGMPMNGGLHYYFDFDLVLKGIGSADNYDMLAEKFLVEGRIKRIPDLEEQKSQIRYWDGTGWRREPVVSKR